MRYKQILLIVVGCLVMAAPVQAQHESDVIPTSRGDLKITFLGHGSLMFEHEGKVLYVDPFSRVADYSTLPKADVILVTHAHGDHLDAEAIAAVRTPLTAVAASPTCRGKINGVNIINVNRTKNIGGFHVSTEPAYNLVHMRNSGEPYHANMEGCGYIIPFGDVKVYVAGDTENTPEMKKLKDIDIAFLPMNLPYTMTPEMVADAALAFRPKILYPYHFGETDTNQLVQLMKDAADIDVRIRKLK